MMSFNQLAVILPYGGCGLKRVKEILNRRTNILFWPLGVKMCNAKVQTLAVLASVLIAVWNTSCMHCMPSLQRVPKEHTCCLYMADKN